MLALAALLLLPAAPAPASADFAAARGDVEALHGPRLAARGLKLQVLRSHDGSGAASALIAGDLASVVVDEGLLAAPRLTDAALRMALCHELGHLSGTEPRRPASPEYGEATGADGRTPYSDEGQADYWAARHCADELLPLSGEAAAPAEPAADRRCAARFGDGPRAALCARVVQAALEFLGSMAMQVPVSLDTPSEEAVEKTTTGYPSRQCRLDTMLAGALELPRPACWFRD